MGEAARAVPASTRYRGPPLSELRSKPHLSVSQLKSFLVCPRRYRLQYIDRVEASFRSVSLALGSAFHHAVEAHYQNVDGHEPASRDQLQQLLGEELRAVLREPGPPVLFDDGDDEATLLSAAAKMLDAFLLNAPEFESVEAIEQPFAVDLVEPRTGEVLGVPLVGAIDVLGVLDGRLTVLELKTSKRKWSRDQLEFDLQLSAYVVAMRVAGYGPVDLLLAIATKTKMPELVLERPTRDASDESDLVATGASVVRAVEAGVDHPVRGWACRSCAYAHACR